MRKKLFYLVFLVLLCFLVVGCRGDITRGIRHSGFNLSNEDFVCDYFVVEDEESIYSNKMQFLSSSFAISEDGEIYELSLSQKYSNNQNCRKSDFSKKVVALFDNKIAMGDDLGYYYITNEGNVSIYSSVGISDSSYEIYDLLFKVDSVLKIVTVDQNNGIYYLLKTDGNIYKYVISRDDTQSPYKIVSNEVIYSSENYGLIKDFNYSNSAITTTYIKSEDNLYRMRIINGEECSKYVDVSCKYDMENDTSLMEYKKYITGFNGSLLITNYGKVFSVA